MLKSIFRSSVVLAMISSAALGQEAGLLVCWGNNNQGQCNAPSGAFLEIAGGGSYSIARRCDVTIACWRENTNGQCSPTNVTLCKLLRGDGIHWGCEAMEWFAVRSTTAMGNAMPRLVHLSRLPRVRITLWDSGRMAVCHAGEFPRRLVFSASTSGPSRWRRVITTLLASWIPPSPVRRISTMTSLSIRRSDRCDQ